VTTIQRPTRAPLSCRSHGRARVVPVSLLGLRGACPASRAGAPPYGNSVTRYSFVFSSNRSTIASIGCVSSERGWASPGRRPSRPPPCPDASGPRIGPAPSECRGRRFASMRGASHLSLFSVPFATRVEPCRTRSSRQPLLLHVKTAVPSKRPPSTWPTLCAAKFSVSLAETLSTKVSDSWPQSQSSRLGRRSTATTCGDRHRLAPTAASGSLALAFADVHITQRFTSRLPRHHHVSPRVRN
jgi:hypothetical protein